MMVFIISWDCIAAGGNGALHKVDGIMRKEHYVDILKQDVKTTVRKFKLGGQWVFQMDDDQTTRVVVCFTQTIGVNCLLPLFSTLNNN